jgi:flagellar biosynthesis chaperone FliJ
MAVSGSADFQQLGERIERAHRRSLIRTVALSVATVVIAALFLVFTWRELDRANMRLSETNAKIAEAVAARAKAERDLNSAQAALKSSVEQATKLQQQISSLTSELARSKEELARSKEQLEHTKQQLADALNLDKYKYNLRMGQLKMMAVETPAAQHVLNVIERLSKVPWGLSNTPSGGYNSPGFAELVLHELGRLPPGANLGSLPHDSGAPRLGDIVVYDAGYHLFYFRDHEKQEFVMGMTPLGVLALKYDFGSRRTEVLRTGISTK